MKRISKFLIQALSVTLLLLGLVFNVQAAPLLGPVPDELTLDFNGVIWAWASPCAGWCSQPSPSYQEGWRYATDEEWAARPSPWDFLAIPGDISSVMNAAPYFDPIYTHVDFADALEGNVTSHPIYGYPGPPIPGGNGESWFVFGGITPPPLTTPEPTTMLLLGLGLVGLAGIRRKL